MQKEVRQHMGGNVSRGEKIDQDRCPSLSVRLSVSGWRGGYFQVELTRKDGVLDYGQQAPQPKLQQKCRIQGSELRAQELGRTGGGGLHLASDSGHLGQPGGQAGRAVSEEGSVAFHSFPWSELCGPIRGA